MYKRLFISTLIVLFFGSVSLLASGEQSSVDSIKTEVVEEFTIAKDDPIVAMLDSLALLTVFRNIEKRKENVENLSNFPPGFVPEYSDSVYNERFKELNAYSTIEFVYNPYVKTFINLYANRRRDLTERVMGLGQLYYPLFEEQLDKYNLPLELKYLAVIESALNPVARSRVGATGLWQFMYGTGKMYGLQVNTMVDDRSDIYKSTIAACEHFVDLYKIYNDWNLVLCAYNAGPGNVNRAIRRAGGVRDFWAIRHFLPRETQNYVPAFMAVTYVMENAHAHNLYPNPPIYSHFDVDTLKVTQQLSLRTVSEFLDIPLDHLNYLNPTFRQNIIPYNARNPYYLRLPRDYTGLFIANADTIYNHRTPQQIRQEEMAGQMAETTIHVVRSGEVLGSIARQHGTSVSEIQRLNNIRGTLIRPGQRLVVRAPARPVTQLASNTNTHVVRSGETLGVIASRYRITVRDIQHWNNISGTTIHPGQNLVVRRPKGMEQATASEPETDTTVKEELKYIYYTVQQGDTLYDIAEKFEHISLEELKEINDLSADSGLNPGQKIKITVETLEN
ncbi:MAG: LysM peptidoglycan-binding domain-containing protein [Bacteroidetes bacterium]|nr:MAG: LysM peptidoglycan-binding domain-containing protein [Bacteroidota bacterium]